MTKKRIICSLWGPGVIRQTGTDRQNYYLLCSHNLVTYKKIKLNEKSLSCKLDDKTCTHLIWVMKFDFKYKSFIIIFIWSKDSNQCDKWVLWYPNWQLLANIIIIFFFLVLCKQRYFPLCSTYIANIALITKTYSQCFWCCQYINPSIDAFYQQPLHWACLLHSWKSSGDFWFIEGIWC